MTRRICSLWLPNLAIERWAGGSNAPEARPEQRRREALARPLVLTVEGRHGQLIHATTPAASERGAWVGARLADARALDPALEAEAADLAGEAAWLRAAARWASRWSPLVEVDGTDALRLDVTGVAHLFGGEAALLADIEARFAGMAISAQAAIAPTAGAAWALARYGRQQRLAGSDELHRILAPLPVAALRLSPQAVHMLVRLGLKQVVDLAGVPRKSLARRFPKDEHPLDALDRALGRKPEPLTPLPDDPPPRALLPIKEPVVHPEAPAEALRQLVPRLAVELERRKLGARYLALTAFRVDGSLGEVEVATSIPSREPAHLHRLLSGILERQGIDPGFGIDAFALEVRSWERLDSAQDALLGDAPGELAVAALVDRLSVRLGPAKVRRPLAVESHLPERAAGWVEGVAGTAPLAQPEGENPTRLLDRPEGITVIYATPEGLPRRFVWRRRIHDISRAQGPRRVSPEWWRERSTARLRDYYKVEDSDGRRFWIFREGVIGDGRGGAPEWFVHGLFA
ncbi:DNA polymerase Y family protein [Sphingomonas glaciei]|uniref:DNA polymerase Y family protein n=1 Tax=Sphingomonas glaciei TaxID=2938948 RepID=A0ABY5MRK2_9SPHN|nr:DNA polymerase Y family protein [Sphingomonas glaciei]UUR07123.1 DNA polymerase Y family protein [Sphingomonas glaciei]